MARAPIGWPAEPKTSALPAKVEFNVGARGRRRRCVARGRPACVELSRALPRSVASSVSVWDSHINMRRAFRIIVSIR